MSSSKMDVPSSSSSILDTILRISPLAQEISRHLTPDDRSACHLVSRNWHTAFESLSIPIFKLRLFADDTLYHQLNQAKDSSNVNVPLEFSVQQKFYRRSPRYTFHTVEDIISKLSANYYSPNPNTGEIQNGNPLGSFRLTIIILQCPFISEADLHSILDRFKLVIIQITLGSNFPTECKRVILNTLPGMRRLGYISFVKSDQRDQERFKWPDWDENELLDPVLDPRVAMERFAQRQRHFPFPPHRPPSLFRLDKIQLNLGAFLDTSQFLQKLIGIAPNLSSIVDVDLNFYELITAPSLLPQVGLFVNRLKSLNFTYNPFRPITDKIDKKKPRNLIFPLHSLRMISQNCPAWFDDHIEHCKPYQHWLKVCSFFVKVLSNCQERLEKLELEPLPSTLARLDRLHLAHLRVLRVRDSWNLCGSKKWQLFPVKKESVECSLETDVIQMPRLVRIEIQSCLVKGLDFDQFLNPWIFRRDGTSFSHVYALRLVHDQNGFDHLEAVGVLEKLAGVFPRIRRLEIGEASGWFRLLPTIWRVWPRLKEICMEVDMAVKGMLTMDIGEEDRWSLDEILTGIPEVQCRTLREFEEQLEINLRDYRGHYAISTMEELELFQINFKMNGQRMSQPTLSHVAGFYGFRLMRRLQVRLIVLDDGDEGKTDLILGMLKPLRPFVEIEFDFR